MASRRLGFDDGEDSVSDETNRNRSPFFFFLLLYLCQMPCPFPSFSF